MKQHHSQLRSKSAEFMWSFLRPKVTSMHPVPSSGDRITTPLLNISPNPVSATPTPVAVQDRDIFIGYLSDQWGDDGDDDGDDGEDERNGNNADDEWDEKRITSDGNPKGSPTTRSASPAVEMASKGPNEAISCVDKGKRVQEINPLGIIERK